MFIAILLSMVWLILMLRAGAAEYRYYQSVKTLEPSIWQQLGAPTFLRMAMVFVSPSNAKLLKTISNKEVLELAHKHHQAGLQFIAYVIVVLTLGTAYFTLA